MTKLLKGKDVVDVLNKELVLKTKELETLGIIPTLAVLRIGEEPGDVAYERGAIKRAETIGIKVKQVVLERNISQAQLIDEIEKLNVDKNIHGVLVLRPFPNHIDDSTVRNSLSTKKDVDGITDLSMAGVYTNTQLGYPPCTAEACMETLKAFGIGLEGKNVAIIGRSLVVGKPVAMMLNAKNATVTLCHSKTNNLNKIAQESDILIVAAGKAKIVSEEYFSEKQIIIDVGINMDEEGNLCGDVDFKKAEGIVKAITPVPGGIGTVTTSMLIKHVIEAAYREYNYE